jgi:hypothetical protein
MSMFYCRLTGRTYIGAKMDPGVGALHKLGTALEVVIYSEPADFVTAERYEQAIAHRLGRGERPHYLKPTRQSASAPARALPPAAAWGRYHEGGKAWIGSSDLCCDVERLRCCPLDVGDKRGLHARLCLLGEALGFRA